MEDDFDRINRILSHNLRELRGLRAISQESLALDADVDRTYVSQIERGTGNPSLRVLCKLASTLEVSLMELFQERTGTLLRPDPPSALARRGASQSGFDGRYMAQDPAQHAPADPAAPAQVSRKPPKPG